MYYIYPGRVTSIQAEVLSLKKYIKENVILCSPIFMYVLYSKWIVNLPIELVSNIGPAGSIAIIPVNKGVFSLDAQVSFLLYS